MVSEKFEKALKKLYNTSKSFERFEKDSERFKKFK